MKLLITILTLFATLTTTSLARDIEIGSVPESVGDFLTLRQELSNTPEGGAACFVAALLAFSKSKDVGLQCLTVAVDKRSVNKGNVYKGYQPNSGVMYHVNRISGYNMWPYLGYAYIKGAKADNNYAVSEPLKVEIIRQKNSGKDSSGKVKVLVAGDGFRPRPITLRRNDKGVWKALEFSSLMLNVSPPASMREGDDL